VRTDQLTVAASLEKVLSALEKIGIKAGVPA
jgi:hypothetical protein